MLAIRHSLAVLVVAVGVAAASDTTTDPSPEPSAGRIMFQRAPGGEVVEADETNVYVMSADGNEGPLLAHDATVIASAEHRECLTGRSGVGCEDVRL
jgi:hypothetical protein